MKNQGSFHVLTAAAPGPTPRHKRKPAAPDGAAGEKSLQ